MSAERNGPMPEATDIRRDLRPGDPDDRPGYSQLYVCGIEGCENSLLLAEHPTRGPITIRAPCLAHGAVEHVAVGREPACEPLLERLYGDADGDADDGGEC